MPKWRAREGRRGFPYSSVTLITTDQYLWSINAQIKDHSVKSWKSWWACQKALCIYSVNFHLGFDQFLIFRWSAFNPNIMFVHIGDMWQKLVVKEIQGNCPRKAKGYSIPGCFPKRAEHWKHFPPVSYWWGDLLSNDVHILTTAKSNI